MVDDAQDWLDRFAEALHRGDAPLLFHDECHWRDLLTLTFTLTTLEGRDRVPWPC